MNRPVTIESTIHFQRRGPGRQKKVRSGAPPTPTPFVGRIPRVAKLMALAIRFDHLIATGIVTDYAELARLTHVSRARMSQIMNLRMLAPDIQEALLLLPRVTARREPIRLEYLQQIALIPDWRKQKRLWTQNVLLVNRTNEPYSENY